MTAICRLAKMRMRCRVFVRRQNIVARLATCKLLTKAIINNQRRRFRCDWMLSRPRHGEDGGEGDQTGETKEKYTSENIERASAPNQERQNVFLNKFHCHRWRRTTNVER